MQIIQSKGNIVEKVIRDKDGKLIRARFFVFENNGRIKARLMDFVYLTEQAVIGCVNFLLSGIAKAKQVFQKVIFSVSYTSPFTKTNLYFSGSKPRAPTL
ncbi:MAG: hypothetical protein EXS47_00150 [Candidatus Zambryskibacteria bacterium]|nr:hypothetical protein [Candidatus Zambryskibacteria bacterium]